MIGLRPAVPTVLAVLGSAVLAGCVNEGVTAGNPSSMYTPSEVVYAASDRDMRVVVLGNPFGMEPQAFGRLVTDNMQGRILGVRTHFTTTPNQSARPDYSVVFAFNPAETTLSGALCAGQPIPTMPPGAPPGGPITVQGAFCRGTGFLGLIGQQGFLGILGGGALTTASGWLNHPTGPDDPAFRTLIGDMTSALFPSGQDTNEQN
ncbi:hypothetical protein DM194_02680 [Azospirillum ramasamyi]|uniref:DUF4136 domain-containing protein n=1 Tax=Azospirillum ramasamyi TaxID=682998 RepID=A0A2U9S137_9PROT|nr:hypothetical protein DM194_02680 [Azospirillum ramasamyi]